MYIRALQEDNFMDLLGQEERVPNPQDVIEEQDS